VFVLSLSEVELEIKTYLTIIGRKWWLILLVTIVTTIASFYASRLIPLKYEVVATLRVITPLGGSLGDISYQTYYADRLMNTYAQIAASEQVINEVKTKLALADDPNVSVKTFQNSEILTVTVTGPDAVLAAKTANTFADIIIEKSVVNATNIGSNSGNIDVLTSRKSSLEQELAQAKQDREKLIEAYAQSTAQMSVLDRTIQMKESEYSNLKTQYQQAIIGESNATSPVTKTQAQNTQKILSDEITKIDAELTSLRSQYQKIFISSSTYFQQIDAATQSVQNKESAYNTLLTQIDSVGIANSKRESAQDLVIASPAIATSKPIGPSKILIIGLGFIVGIVGSTLLTFLWNSLDTRIASIEQLRDLTKLPILGTIPPLNRKDRLSPFRSSDLKVQRACGALYTKIMAVRQTRQVKSILFVSPNPAEGKSTVMMAIAEGLGKANLKVLIVDTDLRRPKLYKLFHASNKAGLSSYLAGESTLVDAIQSLEDPRVDFIASGSEGYNQPALFDISATSSLIKNTIEYDLILFDSPAIFAVPDAVNLAMTVDGIILVVQWKRTLIEDIQALLFQLEDQQNKFIGTIVNRVPSRRVAYYYDRKPFRPFSFPGGLIGKRR
jgi:polysaccharide biosynthesis transport protein